MACGPGKCAAGNTCDYFKVTQSCGASSCTAGVQTDHFCSAVHVCTAKNTTCSPNTCNATSTACRTGCVTHAHCVPGGLCDRRQAHAQVAGLGICIEAGKVVTVGAGEEIAAVLS